MRTFITLLILTVYTINVNAQEIKQHLLNRYFEVTTVEKEAFFYRLSQPLKGYWAYTDYDGKNNVVRTGYFTDSTYSTPIGPHAFFWDGKPIYKGRYVDGQPSGYWYFFNNKGVVYDSLHYVVKPKSNTKASFPQSNDVAEEKKTEQLQNEHMKKDTSVAYATVEKEASFPGGEKSWAKYLTKQLSLPDLIMAINKPQRMTVEVQFVVCNDGEICSVEALNSSHPLLDLMAVNAIRKGPKWDPAIQNNKHVKAWRRQKISFIIPED